MMAKYIPDKNILWLVSVIVGSFYSGNLGVGLPLGNLTSQLLSNIYMNEFDQFAKHRLKAEHYIRYADDFAIFSSDQMQLEIILLVMQKFLAQKLKLSMHPNKVFIKTAASGIDFLGWVHFPDHRVLRTVTRKRMFENIRTKKGKFETIQSCKGLVSHGNGWKLRQKIENRQMIN